MIEDVIKRAINATRSEMYCLECGAQNGSMHREFCPERLNITAELEAEARCIRTYTLPSGERAYAAAIRVVRAELEGE